MDWDPGDRSGWPTLRRRKLRQNAGGALRIRAYFKRFFPFSKAPVWGRGRTAEGMDICQILFWNGSVPFQLGDNVSAATQTIRFVP
jgi:hypothetical protein